MHKWAIGHVVLVLVVLAGGVARAGEAPGAPPPRPLVLHLPGVGGPTSSDRRYVNMLREAMPEAEVVLYDWTGGDPGVGALRGRRRNEVEAKKLAEALAERCRADGRQKIYLSGHSGGTAIAVWILERLPAEVKVESVLLLASALSPGYDLTAALRQVNDRMYAFSSRGDRAVLAAGTRLLGTMDGVFSEAAGYAGFVRPEGGDEVEYQKLVERRYDRRWTELGNIGDHMGVLAAPFARAVLVPLWLGVEARE